MKFDQIVQNITKHSSSGGGGFTFGGSTGQTGASAFINAIKNQLSNNNDVQTYTESYPYTYNDHIDVGRFVASKPVEKRFRLGGDFMSGANNDVFVDGFEDPACLTFKVEFGEWGASMNDLSIIREMQRSILETNTYLVNYDTMPMGLLDLNFMEPDKLASNFSDQTYYNAVNYLYSRNEDRRAQYARDFIEGMYYLQHDFKYLFNKITGLNKLNDFDAVRATRLKDCTIRLEMLPDGLDQKVRTLMELYRKAAWDDVWQRWVLPDIYRYFKMIIYVFDKRVVHTRYGAGAYEQDYFPIMAYECGPCEFVIKDSPDTELTQDYMNVNTPAPAIEIKVYNVKTFLANNMFNRVKYIKDLVVAHDHEAVDDQAAAEEYGQSIAWQYVWLKNMFVHDEGYGAFRYGADRFTHVHGDQWDYNKMDKSAIMEEPTNTWHYATVSDEAYVIRSWKDFTNSLKKIFLSNTRLIRDSRTSDNYYFTNNLYRLDEESFLYYANQNLVRFNNKAIDAELQARAATLLRKLKDFKMETSDYSPDMELNGMVEPEEPVEMSLDKMAVDSSYGYEMSEVELISNDIPDQAYVKMNVSVDLPKQQYAKLDTSVDIPQIDYMKMEDDVEIPDMPYMELISDTSLPDMDYTELVENHAPHKFVDASLIGGTLPEMDYAQMSPESELPEMDYAQMDVNVEKPELSLAYMMIDIEKVELAMAEMLLNLEKPDIDYTQMLVDAHHIRMDMQRMLVNLKKRHDAFLEMIPNFEHYDVEFIQMMADLDKAIVEFMELSPNLDKADMDYITLVDNLVKANMDFQHMVNVLRNMKVEFVRMNPNEEKYDMQFVEGIDDVNVPDMDLVKIEPDIHKPDMNYQHMMPEYGKPNMDYISMNPVSEDMSVGEIMLNVYEPDKTISDGIDAVIVDNGHMDSSAMLAMNTNVSIGESQFINMIDEVSLPNSSVMTNMVDNNIPEKTPMVNMIDNEYIPNQMIQTNIEENYILDMDIQTEMVNLKRPDSSAMPNMVEIDALESALMTGMVELDKLDSSAMLNMVNPGDMPNRMIQSMIEDNHIPEHNEIQNMMVDLDKLDLSAMTEMVVFDNIQSYDMLGIVETEKPDSSAMVGMKPNDEVEHGQFIQMGEPVEVVHSQMAEMNDISKLGNMEFIKISELEKPEHGDMLEMTGLNKPEHGDFVRMQINEEKPEPVGFPEMTEVDKEKPESMVHMDVSLGKAEFDDMLHMADAPVVQPGGFVNMNPMEEKPETDEMIQMTVDEYVQDIKMAAMEDIKEYESKIAPVELADVEVKHSDFIYMNDGIDSSVVMNTVGITETEKQANADFRHMADVKDASLVMSDIKLSEIEKLDSSIDVRLIDDVNVMHTDLVRMPEQRIDMMHTPLVEMPEMKSVVRGEVDAAMIEGEYEAHMNDVRLVDNGKLDSSSMVHMNPVGKKDDKAGKEKLKETRINLSEHLQKKIESISMIDPASMKDASQETMIKFIQMLEETLQETRKECTFSQAVINPGKRKSLMVYPKMETAEPSMAIRNANIMKIPDMVAMERAEFNRVNATSNKGKREVDE